MADYVSITQAGTGLVLYAYEHPSDRVAAIKVSAESVVRAHQSQTSERMCYSSSGYRFLCASHPGYVVCSVFPAAVPTTAAEDFQTRVVGAFTEHVRGELGACDAATLGAVTKSYRFVRFDRELRTLRRASAEASGGGDGSSAARRVTRQLEQVEGYMRQNVSDLLGRGVALDEVDRSTSALVDASKSLRSKARTARIWAQVSQYWPLAAAGAVVLVVVWFVFL